MITISLTLARIAARILSQRPGRPQIQPICWQLYWNTTYMAFDYVNIIWRRWSSHLGPWFGTLLMALCEQNVMSFVASGGRLFIFVPWWDRIRDSCPKDCWCNYNELTIGGMSLLAQDFAITWWISILRFSHLRPASKKAIDSDVFQGRFRYEPTLILIQNHQKDIE